MPENTITGEDEDGLRGQQGLYHHANPGEWQYAQIIG
jgi:hypothetical protein